MDNYNIPEIAILIIAHKNIEQLTRLIQSFENKVDIFIHLDKKFQINQYEIDMLKSLENVHISEERISGTLDDFSLIEISLNLLNIAKRNNNYLYYALLSGQDYPIQTIDNIINSLKIDYPSIYLDCNKLEKNNFLDKKVSLPKWYQEFNKFINKKINYGIYRKTIKLPFYLISKLFIGPKYKFFDENIELYGGSAWWILSDDAVDYVLLNSNDQNLVYNLFKDIYTPEESYFQTVIMNSKYSKDVIHNYDGVSQKCKTYAFFEDDTHPNVGHPHIITSKQLNKINELRKSGIFFARKFDYDNDVFDEIDKEKCK